MQTLSPGWQDLTDLQWQKACRREAVIWPLAEQGSVREAKKGAIEAVGSPQKGPRVAGKSAPSGKILIPWLREFAAKGRGGSAS
jgi:hypothetical protein